MKSKYEKVDESPPNRKIIVYLDEQSNLVNVNKAFLQLSGVYTINYKDKTWIIIKFETKNDALKGIEKLNRILPEALKIEFYSIPSKISLKSKAFKPSISN